MDLDIEVQTRACIENMRDILEKAGGGLDNLNLAAVEKADPKALRSEIVSISISTNTWSPGLTSLKYCWVTLVPRTPV